MIVSVPIPDIITVSIVSKSIPSTPSHKIVFILSSKLYFFIFDMALFKHEALLSLATQRTFLYLVKYISRS